MNTNALIIFTRNPELGKVKTRLAKAIGNEKALQVYLKLLAHTHQITKNLNCDKYVFYSEKMAKTDLWDNNTYFKQTQHGEDLGIRMLNAFKAIFAKGYQKVIVIGSDVFEINQTHIEDAFNFLNNNDIVIGPAVDGGYYLLGMKELLEKIFYDKKWGTNEVLKDTLEDTSNHQIHLLEVLNDIDTIEDLKDIKI